MQRNWHSYIRYTSYLLFAILVINLAILDIGLFANKSLVSPLFVSNATTTSQQKTEPLKEGCDSTCVDMLYQAIKNATSSSSVTQSVTNTTSPVGGEREYYISFGSGSNATADWADIPGLQAYIDTTKYDGIKSARFEASIVIVNGNQKAYARLYNVTDKHPVWFSEVSLEGGQPTLLISDPISLDVGNKLYQVQMKTQLQSPTNLLQSRIHIIAK